MAMTATDAWEMAAQKLLNAEPLSLEEIDDLEKACDVDDVVEVKSEVLRKVTKAARVPYSTRQEIESLSKIIAKLKADKSTLEHDKSCLMDENLRLRLRLEDAWRTTEVARARRDRK